MEGGRPADAPGSVPGLTGHDHRSPGPDAARIRQCGDPPCTRLFVDTSRARSRRWCDMAGCGNRAKVAGFRARNSADRAARTRS